MAKYIFYSLISWMDSLNWGFMASYLLVDSLSGEVSTYPFEVNEDLRTNLFSQEEENDAKSRHNF